MFQFAVIRPGHCCKTVRLWNLTASPVRTTGRAPIAFAKDYARASGSQMIPRPSRGTMSFSISEFNPGLEKWAVHSNQMMARLVQIGNLS
jgi:hypothetical protein